MRFQACLIFGQYIGQEITNKICWLLIMFDEHLARKQALLDYKNIGFT